MSEPSKMAARPHFDLPAPEREVAALEWLANVYARARTWEAAAAQRLVNAADATNAKRAQQFSRAQRTHLAASKRLMLARRDLADATARVLVRRHRVDCRCTECSAERAALGPAPRRRPTARKAGG